MNQSFNRIKAAKICYCISKNHAQWSGRDVAVKRKLQHEIYKKRSLINNVRTF